MIRVPLLKCLSMTHVLLDIIKKSVLTRNRDVVGDQRKSDPVELVNLISPERGKTRSLEFYFSF